MNEAAKVVQRRRYEPTTRFAAEDLVPNVPSELRAYCARTSSAI